MGREVSRMGKQCAKALNLEEREHVKKSAVNRTWRPKGGIAKMRLEM